MYYRPSSSFNPTFTSPGVPMPYNYTGLIEYGYLPASALKAEKLKFISYNSNILARRICFQELTSLFTSTNAVFYINAAPFKWTMIDECYFDIMTRVVFSVGGSNIKLTNTLVNMTNLDQLCVFSSSTSCSDYFPENTLISNNLIYDNNTFFGNNILAYR